MPEPATIPIPHPAILPRIAQMPYSKARKWLRSFGCTKAEQSAIIRAAKAAAQLPHL